jgi:DNA-nicking Smr family endonuclease
VSSEEDVPPVVIPVTGELDLHTFAPRDIPPVVEEYVRECASKGLPLVRLVHGRGRGVQRAVVRRVLAGLAEVEEFHDAPSGSGGWGATVACLRRKNTTR